MASKLAGTRGLSALFAAGAGCGGHGIREVESPESACVHGNIVFAATGEEQLALVGECQPCS